MMRLRLCVFSKNATVIILRLSPISILVMLTLSNHLWEYLPDSSTEVTFCKVTFCLLQQLINTLQGATLKQCKILFLIKKRLNDIVQVSQEYIHKES